jgi:tetratricopeptide (TPR) repeat protein
MHRYRAEILVCLLLIAVTIWSLGDVCGNGFVNYDDTTYVVKNPHLPSGLTPNGIAWAFTSSYAGNWHPVTWLSYLLEYQLFGPRAEVFHLTNLLLHIATAVLLFLVLRRLTGAVGRSGIVAALFAVHPLHVESVAWVAERKDVLSAFFGILTIGAYVRYVERQGPWRYLLVLLLYALGLMAKPMLVTLPCLLLLLDYWPLGRVKGEGWRVAGGGSRVEGADKRSGKFLSPPPTALHPPPTTLLWLVLEKVPLFALSALSCVATLMAQHASGAVRSLEQVPLDIRIANALLTYGLYAVKMIVPTGLAVYYPYPGVGAPMWPAAAAGALLAGVTALVLKYGRRYPFLPVGWFWYLGTLLPVIGLVQVGAQGMADRYTYLPLIGLFIMLTWGADAALHLRRQKTEAASPKSRIKGVSGERGAIVVFCTSCFLLLLYLVPLSRAQVTYWHDSVALWTHALGVTGSNYIAESNLGLALFDLVLARQPEKLPEAELHFAAAERLRPDSEEAQGNLGMALLAQGKFSDAEQHLARAVALNPASAKAHNNLGEALLGQGKTAAAKEHFLQALQFDPTMVDGRGNLGRALLAEGQTKEAIAELAKAVAADPTYAKGHDALARALALQGDLDQAVQHFDLALRLRPGLPDTHYQLGTVLVQQGKPAAAIEQFRQALRYVPDHPEYLSGLAVAYARVGRFGEAVTAARRALAVASSVGRSDLSAQLEEKIRAYEKELRSPGFSQGH